MAMGRRDRQEQGTFWLPAEQVARGPGHPFYGRLNEVFAEWDFDGFVEGLCERFYAREGRPGIPPGVYFRMLLIGFFEGIDSERGIDWRCSDSLTLRQFLGYALTESTPDHSTLCTIRQRIDLETHRAVFGWVLGHLAEEGLLKGKTLGVDATTLEANAAMRSIVRRDSGASYEEFLTGLAEASGIETPSREELAKVDKTRKNKASNDDWQNPHDPDAKITKMKDGRTHLAHKAEHASDLDSGAIVAVTLQPADRGDTSSLGETLSEAAENLREAADSAGDASQMSESLLAEVVADKGYHSNDTCRDCGEAEIRSYISEPERGRRRWTDRRTGQVKSAERDAVYGNRRRIGGERGKALLRKRGELVERPFAHCYDTGGMRRTHLRGRGNILKRLLIHVAGFNLALLMRATFGIGKPRSLQDGLKRLAQRVFGGIWAVHWLVMAVCDLWRRKSSARPKSSRSQLRNAAA